MVRYTGSGRRKEGGLGATHKQDFNAHTSGEDFRHLASNIDVDTLGSTIDLQTVLNTLTQIDGTQGFITIGDGYDESTDLADAFNAAFDQDRLANGGMVVVKPGRYSLKTTVTVPRGITIFGESDGVVIIGEMQNQPMFSIPEATLYEDVKPTSTIIETVRSQRINTIMNIVFYDNLNNVILSGSPSMSTVPMIRCARGSDLFVYNCKFIGRALSPTDISYRVISYNTSTSSSRGCNLRFENNYIDGFESAIRFNTEDFGSLDSLIIQNNRINVLGGGATGTSEDRAAITTHNCNLLVKNNHITGTFTTWESTSLLDFFTNSNTDVVDIIIKDNTGGIIGYSGEPPLIQNTDRISENAKIILDNTWGNTAKTSTNGRRVIAGNVYELQDADFGTDLYFSGSRIVIDCRNITTYGYIGFHLDYFPDDGEELILTIVNSSIVTPSITYLNLNRTSVDEPKFFVNTTNLTDRPCPDPNAGNSTIYKFIFNSLTGCFDLILKSTSTYITSELTYELLSDDLRLSNPQRSFSILKTISASSSSNYDSVSSSTFFGDRPVYSRRTNALYMSAAANKLIYTQNGSDWSELQLGSSISGSFDFRLAVTDEHGASTFMASRISSSSLLVFRTIRSAFGPISQTGVTSSISLSGVSQVGCIIYHGPGSQRFLVGHNNGISYITNTYTSETARVLAGNNILDISRAPDGRIMAISSNSVFLYTPTTPGDFTTAPTFSSMSETGLSGSFRKVSYNRILNLWIIATLSGSSYTFFSSSDGNTWDDFASSSSSAGLLSDLQMIGNATVASFKCNTSGWGGLFYTNNLDRMLSIAVNNTDGLGFVSVGWVGGKLIAIKERTTGSADSPIAVFSTESAGMYGPLDFDK